VNNLTTGISTSKLSQGNCGQTALAEVEKFMSEPPDVNVFSAPDGG
jgi:trimethylamine-N-oxide reductase (cytochrome c)